MTLASYYYDGIVPAGGIVPGQDNIIPGMIGMRTYMNDQSGATAWEYADYAGE